MARGPSLKNPGVVAYAVSMHVALVSGLVAVILAFSDLKPATTKTFLITASLLTIVLIATHCLHLCAGRERVESKIEGFAITISALLTGASFLCQPWETNGEAFLCSCIISFIGYIISVGVFAMNASSPPQISDAASPPPVGSYVSIVDGFSITSLLGKGDHVAVAESRVLMDTCQNAEPKPPPYNESASNEQASGWDFHLRMPPPSYYSICLPPGNDQESEEHLDPSTPNAPPSSSPPLRYSNLASL